MSNKNATVTLDAETFQMLNSLARHANRTIGEMIRELVRKEKSKTEFKITEDVKRISGLIKTSKDYKTLREQCIEERIAAYENID